MRGGSRGAPPTPTSKHTNAEPPRFLRYLSYTKNLQFGDLGARPLDQWANMPEEGKQSIVGAIAVLEILTEIKKPHYTKGGEGWKFDPLGIADSLTPEQLKVKQTKELNNGRLAMIGARPAARALAPPFARFLTLRRPADAQARWASRRLRSSRARSRCSRRAVRSKRGVETRPRVPWSVPDRRVWAGTKARAHGAAPSYAPPGRLPRRCVDLVSAAMCRACGARARHRRP